MSFIILIKLIKLFFFNLIALTFDQWHICDDFGNLQINFVVISVLLVLKKKGFMKEFFFSTYAKSWTFLWHHTLINIFILILCTPLVSHISIPWYSYHCVKIVNFVDIDTTWYEFLYFCLNTRTTMIYKFQKKSNTCTKWVC
jgi:hypothetical protein